ncbi:phage tail protein I [Serratia sp. MF2]|uniref:phage tail protein I n=1 Tax=Serratia sp. MF1(2023) TaxID=3059171 RepID=UPI0027EBF2D8|nr:phage tail protein I [Serratia sp. MF1(2023)]MDQ7104219.1 phage tail protein I [Serratia sp. MF1(2023)]
MPGIELNSISFVDLLPNSINKDKKIIAAAKALDERFSFLHTSIDFVLLWARIDNMDENLLNTLAWQLALLEEPAWALAESLIAKRAVIRGALELHRRKGTPASIREIIRLLGFGEVELIEGTENEWAEYDVKLKSAITNEQGDTLSRALKNFAPARCHLHELTYEAVPIRYNGQAFYNGNYNHGSYAGEQFTRK